MPCYSNDRLSVEKLDTNDDMMNISAEGPAVSKYQVYQNYIVNFIQLNDDGRATHVCLIHFVIPYYELCAFDLCSNTGDFL